jgi:hypothetical protein
MVALTGMQKRGEYLKQVGEALKSPLGHASVLGEYAADKLKRAMKPERLKLAPDELRDEAAALEAQTADFAEAIEGVVKRERTKIVEREHVQHRLSDAAIDLYGMLATIARTAARIGEAGADASAGEIRMTKLFCDGAWRRVRRNLRALEANMDGEADALVDDIRARGGYPVDHLI